MSTSTSISIKLKDLVEAERALSILSSMEMSDKAGWMVSKILRKATPELRQYHKNIASIVEDTKAFKRNDMGPILDIEHEDYEKHYKHLEKKREALLDGKADEEGVDVVLGDGCGTIKRKDLLEALPKRNVGTEEKPEMVAAYLQPWIYTALWWLIVE